MIAATIRPATHADIPALCDLFLSLKRASPYLTQPHDVEHAKATMRRCISSPAGYLALGEHQGRIVGALMGETFKFWWGSRHYASDHAMFSTLPGVGAALVADFCRWAWARPNVIEVLVGQSSGGKIEVTRRFFEGLGFECAGGLFRLSRYDADRLRGAA